MMEPFSFEKQRLAQKLRERYQDECPPCFKDTDASRLPQSSLKQIMAFHFIPKTNGLLIQGNTGLGKTRSAWLLVKRLLCEDVVPVRYVSDPMFSVEYSKRLGNGTAEEYIDQLCRVAVLFLDDFGKSAVTPRYKELFYAVLNERCNNYKPMIITTQWNRQKLVERFGDEDGKAIVRRLTEFCEIVNF